MTVWYETRQRALALTNSKMTYLNVQLHGLSGRPHPVIQNIERTQDAKKLRLHLKFLSGDYLTNERLARDQPGRSPACLLCGAAIDNIEHVLVSCRATKDIRDRLLPDLLNTVAIVQPACQILDLPPAPHILAQFVVDCSSFNLPDRIRIPTQNPGILIFFVCREIGVLELAVKDSACWDPVRLARKTTKQYILLEKTNCDCRLSP